jgi:hypothetical protein
MPRIIEVPTHLNVEDTLLFGLTARQILRLVASLSIAYGLWDQADLPTPIRATLAAGMALLGLMLALVQPGGRPLDQWAFAAAAYALVPRRLAWRHTEPDPAEWRVARGNGWAELDLAVGWLADEDQDADEEDQSNGPGWPRLGRR